MFKTMKKKNITLMIYLSMYLFILQLLIKTDIEHQTGHTSD